MPKLNCEIVLYNLRDAREQLAEIEKLAASGELDEIAFESMIQHAYHHLNFAWNVRHITSKRYSSLTDNEFAEWSKFPDDLEPLGVK